MLPRIACVTHRGSADSDPDLPLAVAALREARLAAEAIAWDAEVDWAEFDLVLVRSPWDYPGRRAEFLRWARDVEARTALANPALTLARNTDLTYLRDLARQGIPTIDSIWLEPGDSPAQCEQEIRRRGWAQCLVRPNIGDEDTVAGIVADADEAVRVAAGLIAGGSLAVVEEAVEGDGEVCVVVIDGRLSHAVRGPRPRAGRPGSPAEAVAIGADLADAVGEILPVAAGEDELLYARVDLVPGPQGWLLRAFEATAPRLFLDSAAGAADDLAWAVRQRVIPDARESDFLAGSG
ncbi:MAG TPA: hypothetical protein PLT68_01580 [Actinomycetota bacterium]|nr:hypothetical protein [Actinomycetota bacterium]